MLIKAMLVPLVLIICFGGGFVALNKPFNSRAVAGIACLALGILGMGYLRGMLRVGAAVILLLGIFLLVVARPKA